MQIAVREMWARLRPDWTIAASLDEAEQHVAAIELSNDTHDKLTSNPRRESEDEHEDNADERVDDDDDDASARHIERTESAVSLGAHSDISSGDGLDSEDESAESSADDNDDDNEEDDDDGGADDDDDGDGDGEGDGDDGDGDGDDGVDDSSLWRRRDVSAADLAFDRDLQRLMAESMEARKYETPRAESIAAPFAFAESLPPPLQATVDTATDGDSNGKRVVFKLMTRQTKRTAPTIRPLFVPVATELAVNNIRLRAADAEERALIKKLNIAGLSRVTNDDHVTDERSMQMHKRNREDDAEDEDGAAEESNRRRDQRGQRGGGSISGGRGGRGSRGTSTTVSASVSDVPVSIGPRGGAVGHGYGGLGRDKKKDAQQSRQLNVNDFAFVNPTLFKR